MNDDGTTAIPDAVSVTVKDEGQFNELIRTAVKRTYVQMCCCKRRCVVSIAGA